MSDITGNNINSGGDIIPSAPANGVQDANLNATQAPLSNATDANSNVTTGTPSGEPEDFKKKFEEVSKKTSVLERERNDFSKKAKQNEDAAKSLQSLDDIFRKSPRAYEAFRAEYKTLTGADLADHSKVYGTPTVSPNNSQANVDSTGNTTNQPLNVEQIAKQVTDKLKQDQENELMSKGAETFRTKHPEYLVEGITDPEELKNKQLRTAYLTQLAVVRKAFYPGEPWEEALENAHLGLPENISEVTKKAQLTGEKIGKATAYSSGSAAGKAPSGDNSNINTMDRSLYDKLNADQKRRYDSHVRQGNVDFANRYAKRILEG